MDRRAMLYALTAGGAAALLCSLIGLIMILGYGILTGEKTVYLGTALVVIGLTSVFAGGLRGGMTAGAQGWLHGSLVAGLYLGVLLLSRGLLPLLSLSPLGILFCAACIILGTAGGVAGVNIRFLTRTRTRRRYMGG